MAGLMPAVIWESWTAIIYVADTAFCIDHLQHTEAEVIVEEILMGPFDEDGALLITAMIQM